MFFLHIFLFFSFVFFNSNELEAADQRLRLTICDSSPRSLDYFQTFYEIAGAAGCSVGYLSINDILDGRAQSQKKPGMFFFIITPELLQGIQLKNYAAESFISFIKEVLSDKTIFPIFCLPTLPQYSASKLQQVLTSLNMPQELIENARVASLFNNAPERRPRCYHTTLMLPSMAGMFRLPARYLPSQSGAYFPLQLPTNVLESVWPVGCLVPKSETFGGGFVTHSSWLTFGGVAENFHMMPLETAAFAALNKQVYLTLKDLSFYLLQGRLSLRDTEKASKQTLPAICTVKYLEKRRTYSKTMQKKLTYGMRANIPPRAAWMELADFEKGDERAMRKHSELIDYIFEGDIGVLWLGISPQWYLMPGSTRATQVQNFIDSVSRFTRMLKAGAEKHDKKIPEITIGFEIANNLRDNNMPKEAAVTLYGDVCHDIWPGTAKRFWKEEVVEPFQLFIKLWKDPLVSNGCKIAGVVLDCEMYGRKKASEYTSLMCYEPSTLAEFLGVTESPGAEKQSQDGLLKKVAAQHLCKKFQSFIEKKAEAIGTYIREEVQAVCPGALMGCYMMRADFSPFHTGLLRGLGKYHPVDFYTFNVSLEPYKAVVERKRLNVHHSSVVMLSKLRKKEDFKILNTLKKYNPSVWGNRISRLPYYEKGSWFELEQTPLDENIKHELMDYWSQVN